MNRPQKRRDCGPAQISYLSVEIYSPLRAHVGARRRLKHHDFYMVLNIPCLGPASRVTAVGFCLVSLPLEPCLKHIRLRFWIKISQTRSQAYCPNINWLNFAHPLRPIRISEYILIRVYRFVLVCYMARMFSFVPSVYIRGSSSRRPCAPLPCVQSFKWDWVWSVCLFSLNKVPKLFSLHKTYLFVRAAQGAVRPPMFQAPVEAFRAHIYVCSF